MYVIACSKRADHAYYCSRFEGSAVEWFCDQRATSQRNRGNTCAYPCPAAAPLCSLWLEFPGLSSLSTEKLGALTPRAGYVHPMACVTGLFLG